jgi:hypothetical protein
VQAHGEVRGTQSFVGIMAAIWKRPSLTGLEVFWRWLVGVPTLALCAWEADRISHMVRINIAKLQAMTVFKPVQATETTAAALRNLAPTVLPVLVWLVPLVLVARIIVATFGRTAVQQKLDRQLRPKRGVLLCLSALRITMLLVALAIWLWGVRWANGYSITGPASRGQEPDVVFLCALVIFGTLALFLVWASTIWIIDAAFVVAGERHSGFPASLRQVLRVGATRSKLVEINLVMGIVKVALIVLVMVFSSCPLPFESVESKMFLAWWWAGVIVLYLIASDYFHVVRMAAYLTLLRAMRTQDTPETKSAS